jgi:hypothetical protein
MASEIDKIPTNLECSNCRVVKFFGTEVLECIEKLDCEWAKILGYGRFCVHPSSLRHSSSKLSRLFA